MTERTAARTGELLRYWRGIRERKQAELASLVGVSAKHLSFIENNHTHPSEELLDRLCDALEMPLHERVLLHRSAGFSGAASRADLDDGQMSRLIGALERVLLHLEPFPAAALTQSFERIASNSALMRLVLWVGGDMPYLKRGGTNMVELLMREDGLRPVLANWEEIARRLLHRLYRESVLDDPHGELAALLDRLLALDGVGAEWQAAFVGDSSPLVPFVFVKDGCELRFDSMITTVGTPLDSSYQHVRLRYFVPTDEPTEQLLKEILAS